MHRRECVRVLIAAASSGTLWLNDSIAQTPDATSRDMRFIVLRSRNDLLPKSAILNQIPPVNNAAPIEVELYLESVRNPPGAASRFVGNANMPSVDLRYNMIVEWDAVIEEIPLFLPSTLRGDQILEIPKSQRWAANEYTLVAVQKDSPRGWRSAFKYFFAGRAVYRGAPQHLRFSTLGPRSLLVWFLGSYELARTSSSVGIDYNLIDAFVELAEGAMTQASFRTIFEEKFWNPNGYLFRQYLSLPSAKDVNIPDNVRDAWLRSPPAR